MSLMLSWIVGWVILGLTGWLCLAAVGALVAMLRDRPPLEGFAIALVFGPLGIAIEAARGDRPPADRSADPGGEGVGCNPATPLESASIAR